MGYINRDGIGPHRIEILRRIDRGEIKTLDDLRRKSNPMPLLLQKNLVHWRGGRYWLTLDGRMLLTEVAEEEGRTYERPSSVRETWYSRVKDALPLLPEQFKSNDVRQALNEEWGQNVMSYIGTSLRLLERQGLVRCLGRDEKNLKWEKTPITTMQHS